jgi:hypothetical protein
MRGGEVLITEHQGWINLLKKSACCTLAGLLALKFLMTRERRIIPGSLNYFNISLCPILKA